MYLDNDTEKQVLEAIQAYVKPDDILIVATHRPGLAAQLANRVIVMQQGEMIADGKPETIIPSMMKNRPVGARSAKPQKVIRPPKGFYAGELNKGPANVI